MKIEHKQIEIRDLVKVTATMTKRGALSPLVASSTFARQLIQTVKCYAGIAIGERTTSRAEVPLQIYLVPNYFGRFPI